jgi:RHS repeat-associated protein
MTWIGPKGYGIVYRFGFNGQEKDDEVKGVGNSINFKYRIHDPRLGRFLSVDPLAPIYAYNSPYAFAENKLGLGKELEGLELWLFGSSSAISLLRPLIEVSTKIEPSRIPSGGVLPPVVTTPPSALPATPMSTPEIEYFDPSTTAQPDATITAPTVDKGPIILEARSKQKSEAEVDEEIEAKKIKEMEERATKAGQTKANTKGQEKEAGQNYEEIKEQQRRFRKDGKPDKIRETKKSEQNDKKVINEKALGK